MRSRSFLRLPQNFSCIQFVNNSSAAACCTSRNFSKRKIRSNRNFSKLRTDFLHFAELCLRFAQNTTVKGVEFVGNTTLSPLSRIFAAKRIFLALRIPDKARLPKLQILPGFGSLCNSGNKADLRFLRFHFSHFYRVLDPIFHIFRIFSDRRLRRSQKKLYAFLYFTPASSKSRRRPSPRRREADAHRC